MNYKWYDINIDGFPGHVLHQCKCLIVIEPKGVGEPVIIESAEWNDKEKSFQATDSYDLCSFAEPIFTGRIEDKHNVIAWMPYPSYSHEHRPYGMKGAMGGRQ